MAPPSGSIGALGVPRHVSRGPCPRPNSQPQPRRRSIYGDLWPDSNERTRTAIDAVFDRPLARAVDGDAGMAAETGL